MAATAQPHSEIQDALLHARIAAQELHAALTDALARHGGALRDDLQSLPDKARAISASIKGSLDAQAAATKSAIGQAATFLEAAATQVAQALETTGRDAERSVKQAVIDARQSVQMISEAVAARRSAASALTRSQK